MLRTPKKPLVVIVIVLVALIAGALILFRPGLLRSAESGSETASPATDSARTAAPVLRFGLPVDSFSLVEETVQRNEFLSDILVEYGIDLPTIANLAAKSKPIFDVRDIRAGNSYAIFCTPDSLHKAEYFVYQPNSIDYIVYDLRDSINIYKGKRAVTVANKTVSGVIQSSLYETLEKSAGDPALAVKLANIFAWTIDFYTIQAGDWFKVVYEERSIHNSPVKESGNVLSAVFSHSGEVYQAYFFQPDSNKAGEYFDENGKSLRRAFLKAPLKFSHITSRYTLRRFHPVQKRWKAHLGTDYAAPTGTPIICTANGVVIESRYTKFNGNYVKVRHNGTYTTQYLHMSRRAVRPGEHVRQGQVIGYVGSTGLATGPHVCYRFWKNGKQVDPLHQHFPPAEPVDKEEKPYFDQLVKKQQSLLEKVLVDSATAKP